MVKSKKLSIGDIFLIPRSDNCWVVGQVLEEWMPNVICIGIFDRVLSKLEAPDDLSLVIGKPFAMPSVAKTEITKGHWPRVGYASVTTNLGIAPHRRYSDANFVGAEWYSGKVVERLIDAYYDLGDWDPYPGRPGELKSLVLFPRGFES